MLASFRALTSARWGIRGYVRYMVLIALTTAFVVTAVTAVTMLGPVGDGTGGTLLLAPAIPSSGLAWPLPATEPAALQQMAVGRLSALLLGLTAATFVVGGLVLLSFCTILGTERGRTYPIARAVGATRGVLLRGAAVEAAIVGGAGALAGGLVGGGAATLARATWPGTAAGAGGWWSATLAGMVVGLVTLGFLFPAWRQVRKRRIDWEPKSRSWILPVIQLGTAMSVTAGGVLLVRHGAEIGPGDDGPKGRLYSFTPPAGFVGVPPGLGDQYADLVISLETTHTTVALASPGSTLGLGTVTALTTECGRCPVATIMLKWHVVVASHFFVSPDSFQAMGLSLREGRLLQANDRRGEEPVVVINRALALDHFENGQAIGRRLKLGTDRHTWHRVVGVVDDGASPWLGGTVQPPYAVYASVFQHPPQAVELLLRPDRTENGVALARVAELMDRRVSSVGEAELISRQAGVISWFGAWFGIEGAALFLLATGGTFAAMFLWVYTIRGEIGIRRAVGASRGAIYGYVLRHAAAVGLGGVAVSVWFGPALWSVLPGVVPNLPAWNWTLLAELAFLLVAIAMGGVVFPARRSLRAPPVFSIDS